MPGETVLIIEDSIALRSLLESILPYGGYDAVSAPTGQEGLDLALELNPDAILVDLELPDMTGLEILERLYKQNSTIPAIMMTGYGSEGVAARALRLGAVAYLIKPFTTEEVLSSIDRAIKLGRLSREKAHLSRLVEAFARNVRIVSSLSQAVVAGLDLAQLFERLVQAGLYVTRAERCLLSLEEEAPDRFRVVSVQGGTSCSQSYFSPEEGDERLQPVLEEGTTVRFLCPSNSTILLQTGDAAKAVLQVPLKTRDRVVGVLSVDRHSRAAPFDKNDEHMLRILADYAVIALERDRQPGMGASVFSE